MATSTKKPRGKSASPKQKVITPELPVGEIIEFVYEDEMLSLIHI